MFENIPVNVGLIMFLRCKEMSHKVVERVIIMIIMIGIVIMYFSCTTDSRQAEKTFEVVEQLMNSHPDSALTLLEAIEYPETLDRPLYYKYVLLLVQAKDKSNKDISKDIIIIREAAAYFTSVNDEYNTAIARFYSGRIYRRSNEDYTDAINEYLIAEELANKKDNDYLLALINYDIGAIFEKQLNYEKCLKYYLLSKEYFSKINNRKQENNVLNHIGNIYLRMDPSQSEKAFAVYNEALEYAMQEKDTMQITVCLNNISIAYSVIGDYDNAKKYIDESFALDKNNEVLFNNYNNLISLYIATNAPDSALYYLNSIFPVVNNNNRDLYYYNKLLYNVFEKKEDYKTALDHYKISQEYLRQIYDENSEKSILEIQNKYDKTKVENLYHQTVIKKQRFQIWFVFSTLLALIIVVISIVLYKNSKKKKRDAEGRIEALNNLLSDSHKSNERLRNRVIGELELTKKIAYIHATDSNKGKKVISEYDDLFNRDLQNALDWQNLYKLIDELYPGFRKTFDGQYPNLTEKEQQMCYLTKAGFKTNEIAYILGYSRESADTMKCKIRKKSGFNSMTEFTEFLNKL